MNVRLFLSLLFIYCQYMTIRTKRHRLLASGSLLDVIDQIYKKPYQSVLEPEPEDDDQPILELDQTEPGCPLPFQSSSRETGCTCDFASKKIECIYSDRLNSVPEFIESNTERHNKSISNSNNASQQILGWNVNLRCRNFSILVDFRNFYKLKSVNLLDLSANHAEERCRINEKKTSLPTEWTESGPLVNQTAKPEPILLTRLGTDANPLQLGPKPNWKLLHIKKLDLASNRIAQLYLNRITANNVQIKSVDLFNNSLDSQLLTLYANLDVCYMELDELNLASNKINQIDLSFLVFLKNLNLSSNYLSRFSIEFFDTVDFREYYNQTCGMRAIPVNATLNATNVLFKSNLVNLDFSNNFLHTLPFGHLQNIAFVHLAYLNLSFNRIKRFNSIDFQHMRMLRHLDLKSNMIEVIYFI